MKAGSCRVCRARCCQLLTGQHLWLGVLAPKETLHFCEWNVGLQSPCAVDICYFCPEELCAGGSCGAARARGTIGVGCACSYPISSTSARMPFPTGAGLGWN